MSGWLITSHNIVFFYFKFYPFIALGILSFSHLLLSHHKNDPFEEVQRFVQWLIIRLATQGTEVQSLVGELRKIPLAMGKLSLPRSN